MRSGSRHRGEAGGGSFGFPPLQAADGRIHKGDCDMRTGANFARGSCRALKWMLVLGALSVLGSAQAFAQALPMVESATYTATGTAVTLTMSQRVYFAGTDVARQKLPSAFSLIGGDPAITAPAGAAIQVDIAGALGVASATITLHFATPIKTLVGTGILELTYTPATPATENEIRGPSGTVLAAITDSNNIRVTGPDEATKLEIDLLPATQEKLEEARLPGMPYEEELPLAEGGRGTIQYGVNTAQLPDGFTLVASLITANDDSLTRLMGMLPAYTRDYLVVYTATDDGRTAPNDTTSAQFTIKVANEPGVIDEPPDVIAAGPSSLTVTWKKPADNNSAITGYRLRYRATGTTSSWLPVFTTIAGTATTHTLTGLPPDDYDVQVVALNELRASGDVVEADWSASGSGSTGAGPGKPTLTLAVDATIPEGRESIPVSVKVTVPASARSSRSVTVTLSLVGVAAAASDPETNAELPVSSQTPDVVWTKPLTGTKANQRVPLVFNFTTELSQTKLVYLKTNPDADAEDEKFRIAASTMADTAGVFSAATTVRANVMVEDAEEQVYRLRLPYALESSGEIKEGYPSGGGTVTVSLDVLPARTLPKSFFVSLESAQDARDYSLTSGGVSSGGPTAVSLRVDLPADSLGEPTIILTPAPNDGDRVNDTITLQLFETDADSPTTAGAMVGKDVMLKVVDQHKLPKVTMMDTITVDGAAVTSLKEGETGTITLMADRGTATDDIPDDEAIKVALTHGAASSASAADYSLSSDEVTIAAKATSGTFMLEVLADEEIDAEELVLQAAVTGVAMYGDAADMVDLGPISFVDGTTKLVYPKMEAELQAVIYAARDAGMGDDMMFNPGETIEIASPGSLFNTAVGVTLSFTAESDMEDVATVAVSGSGMVTVTAQDMAGVMAHITITAHASLAASGAMGVDQTDPSEASVIFPVEVGLEALSFTLMGPEDMMNLTEGMSAMVTATANRAVTADVTINLMRDRAMSTAGDDDYMAEAITIEAGMMMGTTMVMAVEDNMAEEMEELVLYGMAADNAGEVTGQVNFYIWDVAVPALPLIAQLLLGLFLAIGGYRRYLRR